MSNIGRKIKRNKDKLPKLYKIYPFLAGTTNPEIGNLLPDTAHTVETDIDDCVIVSVPTSTSQVSARELKSSLEAVLKKRVLVITHNIHFCQVERVRNKHQAAKIVGRVKAGINARRAIQQQIDNSGSGSGIQRDGDSSNTEVDVGPIPAVEVAEGENNPTSIEEGITEVEKTDQSG